MEPVNYVGILKTHWKVVAALVALAVVVVFLVSPKDASRGHRAEHELLLDAPMATEGEALASMANVRRAELLLTTGEVTSQVAHQLDDDPKDIGGKVEAVVDADIGMVTVGATHADPDQAKRLANAYARAWVDFVDHSEAERYEREAGEDLARVEQIDRRLDQLQDGLLQSTPGQATDGLLAERDDLARERDLLQAAISEIAPPVSYTSLSEATTTTRQAAFVSSREQRVLLAAVVAAVLGFGVAVLLDRNDTRVRTKEDAERSFGLPVLAEVPLLALGLRSRAPVHSYEHEPRVAEAYRSLRTALLLFRKDGPAAAVDHRGPVQPALPAARPHDRSHDRSHDRAELTGNGGSSGTAVAVAGGGFGGQGKLRQLLVVTSPEPGEGKSTTVTNLAMAYAEVGYSVLILSWDLWQPMSPTVLGAEEGPGVSDFLERDAVPLVRYVQDTAVPGVRIVTAGSTQGRSLGRLETVRKLVDQARALANVVIVDTAPILSASATRELVTLADAVVLVGRVGRTSSEAAARCAELIQRIEAPALGVVLVGVATGAFGDYYGPSRRSGYGRAVGTRRMGIRRRDREAAHSATDPRADDLRRSASAAARYRTMAGGKRLP